MQHLGIKLSQIESVKEYPYELFQIDNNHEKVTDFVIEQIKSRCKEFLDEEKYSNIANTSKDKIIKNKYNVKNEILILERKLKI